MSAPLSLPPSLPHSVSPGRRACSRPAAPRRSFSSLELALSTHFGDSAIALAKRTSSHSLARAATLGGAALPLSPPHPHAPRRQQQRQAGFHLLHQSSSIDERRPQLLADDDVFVPTPLLAHSLTTCSSAALHAPGTPPATAEEACARGGSGALPDGLILGPQQSRLFAGAYHAGSVLVGGATAGAVQQQQHQQQRDEGEQDMAFCSAGAGPDATGLPPWLLQTTDDLCAALHAASLAACASPSPPPSPSPCRSSAAATHYVCGGSGALSMSTSSSSALLVPGGAVAAAGRRSSGAGGAGVGPDASCLPPWHLPVLASQQQQARVRGLLPVAGHHLHHVMGLVPEPQHC